jgi:hypothetical protein
MLGGRPGGTAPIEPDECAGAPQVENPAHARSGGGESVGRPSSTRPPSDGDGRSLFPKTPCRAGTDDRRGAPKPPAERVGRDGPNVAAERVGRDGEPKSKRPRDRPARAVCPPLKTAPLSEPVITPPRSRKTVSADPKRLSRLIRKAAPSATKPTSENPPGRSPQRRFNRRPSPPEATPTRAGFARSPRRPTASASLGRSRSSGQERGGRRGEKSPPVGNFVAATGEKTMAFDNFAAGENGGRASAGRSPYWVAMDRAAGFRDDR